MGDLAGNTATFTSPAVNIDKTPPTVSCVRLPRQKRNDDADEGKLLYQVTASDNLSQASITLGTFQLAQGEIFQLRPSMRPGIRVAVVAGGVVSRFAHETRRSRSTIAGGTIRTGERTKVWAGSVGETQPLFSARTW